MVVLPGHILITNIKEDEEALIIRCICLMGSVHEAHLLHSDYVYDMDVNLLGYGRWVEWIFY